MAPMRLKNLNSATLNELRARNVFSFSSIHFISMLVLLKCFVCCGAVQHGTVATSGALSLAQLADIVTRAAGSDNVMDRVHYFIL